MGSCVSKQGKIDKELRRLRAEQKPIRILLLGAGESGKTTVLRQLKLINSNGKGFDAGFKSTLRPHMLQNLMEGAFNILQATKTTHQEHMLTDPKSIAAAKTITHYYIENCMQRPGENIPTVGIANLTRELTEAVRLLSVDQKFLNVLADSSRLQIPDGWSYFMERLSTDEEWGLTGWIPNDADVLHVRSRTAGLVKERFTFGDQLYEVIDVGGQRVERTKWHHQFADINGLIYMQPLSDYDQVMFEDESSNRFLDSFTLFRNTIRNSSFANTAIMVFLNKEDLLRKKYVLLKKPFPEILGADDAPIPVLDEHLTDEENLANVERWYANRVKFAAGPEVADRISIHVVTALETATIQKIVDVVFLNVFQNIMADAGLLMGRE